MTSPLSTLRRSTPEAGISPHPDDLSREHGAEYMRQWQVDEIRKMEGQYMNGKGPVMPARRIMALDLSLNPPKQTAFQRFLSWFK